MTRRRRTRVQTVTGCRMMYRRRLKSGALLVGFKSAIARKTIRLLLDRDVPDPFLRGHSYTIEVTFNPRTGLHQIQGTP